MTSNLTPVVPPRSSSRTPQTAALPSESIEVNKFFTEARLQVILRMFKDPGRAEGFDPSQIGSTETGTHLIHRNLAGFVLDTVQQMKKQMPPDQKTYTLIAESQKLIASIIENFSKTTATSIANRKITLTATHELYGPLKTALNHHFFYQLSKDEFTKLSTFIINHFKENTKVPGFGQLNAFDTPFPLFKPESECPLEANRVLSVFKKELSAQLSSVVLEVLETQFKEGSLTVDELEEILLNIGMLVNRNDQEKILETISSWETDLKIGVLASREAKKVEPTTWTQWLLSLTQDPPFTLDVMEDLIDVIHFAHEQRKLLLENRDQKPASFAKGVYEEPISSSTLLQIIPRFEAADALQQLRMQLHIPLLINFCIPLYTQQFKEGTLTVKSLTLLLEIFKKLKAPTLGKNLIEQIFLNGSSWQALGNELYQDIEEDFPRALDKEKVFTFAYMQWREFCKLELKILPPERPLIPPPGTTLN